MSVDDISFEDALDELLLEYEDVDTDEIISTLELKIHALKEAQENDDTEDP